ncbi:ImcF-related family protein [Silvimonas amylolytica]|uniref:Type VI secretion system protein ImpL n=1 Tax=Silvimonas amylolytica TaxID=449663 RepID=A0ABQ2PMA3_9NEIS|nr:ImcF-related family protein [Silvimonas amylolytica]GGP26355.1 type VI secretion system protein ImpL [Silvimonas amylolytica]
MSEVTPRRRQVVRGVLVLIAIAAIAAACFIWSDDNHFPTPLQKQHAIMLLLASLLGVVILIALWGTFRRKSRYRMDWHARKVQKQPVKPAKPDPFLPLHRYLESHYSWLERQSKPWLLVMGSEALVKAHFPFLVEQHWQDTKQAVLVWAGDKEIVPPRGWRGLRGAIRKPAEGIILVSDGVTAHGRDVADLARASGFALPVHALLAPAVPGYRLDDAPDILLACAPAVLQDTQQTGALVQRLVAPLSQAGMAAVCQDRKACFDIALSQYLEQQSGALGRWMAQWTQFLPRQQEVHGLWFVPTPPAIQLPDRTGDDQAILQSRAQDAAHDIRLPVSWLRTFRWARRPRLAFSAFDWCCCIGTMLAVPWGLGTCYSYTQNKRWVTQVHSNLTRMQTAASLKAAFPAMIVVQGDIALLEYQQAHGAPWLTRFGLNHSEQLLRAMWQPYGLAANKWLVQPVQQQLAAQLKVLNIVPLDGGNGVEVLGDSASTAPQAKDQSNSPEAIGKSGYDTLKTWLMLSDAKHADGGFLAPRLAQTGRVVWPALPMDSVGQVATFYANHLAAQPGWQLAGNDDILFGARQTLSGLIDLKQADDTLYHQLLADTKARYPDPTMGQLLGGRDFRGLWSVQGRLPGTFTRQAYEGYVRDAIVQLSKQTGTSGDWVLGQQTSQQAQTPEDIQASLTRRYFTDFGYAWQNFLNRLVWVPESGLSGTAQQLRTYADAQQSPLAALMKTIVWQAQAGTQQHNLADSLVEKARNAFSNKSADPAQQPAITALVGPLTDTFGPLLRLMGPETNGGSGTSGANGGGSGNAGTTLSLQSYLDRASTARLVLDQALAAPDPDAFALQAAQAVFQGQGGDMVQARNEARLVAASLGSGYAGMGDNLFLKPLEQAWLALMQPASASLNSLWCDSVWIPFNSAMGGRYPFNDTDKEVGLAELARFIAPQGVIAEFAKTELGGLLKREGDQWVPNPLNAQSVRFNVDFLNALNKLSRLSSRLYAEGNGKVRFDLMAMGNPKLTDSKLTIDGQTLDYFNQQQSWERFSWPGSDPDKTGGALSWDRLQGGPTQQEKYIGTWGFIRLLDKAKVEQVDRADWRIDWALDEQTHLRYAVRTQSGAGPLELLQLRHFKLPEKIFITGREMAVVTPALRPSGLPSVGREP